MRLSTKSRYGLRALFDIAYHAANRPVQIQDIARRQEISPRYLEQIFQNLKRAGLLKSKRGPQGGYLIAKPLKDVTVKDIVKATEGDLLLVDCSPGKRKRKKSACSFDGTCVTQTVWTEASSRLESLFSEISLAVLCERGEAMGLLQEDLSTTVKPRRKTANV
ncbi:RrF2 family transcriptional regulator [Geobacter pelophilus]|uniref:RrF2 family transcriptional regulator n=1 Tax=Geoanaerobacter pelophilus TaxID=60036 RepID=A0AAW4L3X7_9BACT|nr:Rrf2 family transcriptional regulator [Geoanaerobacter pelophilus]MBT0665444.1 RrF2 family transcriptional regulator [Geoanaerobacter pelophilus]